MKRIGIFLLLSLFTLSVNAQYKGQLSGNTETLWGIHTAPDGARYISGNKGIILRQDTGCTGWAQQSTSATNGVRGIWFTNDATGYACGTSGTIFKTTDRGDNWTALSSGTNVGLLDIEFINDTVGYTVGGGSAGYFILRTQDAGANWVVIDSNLTTSPFDITFVNEVTGYLAGVGGLIMKTVDGGANWTVLVAGVIGNPTWTSIHFTDAQTGYVVGQSGNIQKTTNGGTTWTSLTSGTTQYLNGINFQNDTTGYVVGNSGTVLLTTDAGTTFQPINFTHQSAFRGVVADSNQVLFCGSDGVVFEYDSTFSYQSVFYESFCNVKDSVTAGSGWTLIAGNNPAETWRFDNPNANNGLPYVFDAPFASFDSQYYGSSDQDSATLESPEFDVSDFTDLTLQWSEAFLPNYQGQVYSTIQGWDGNNWITLYSSNGGYNSSSSGIGYTASYTSGGSPSYRRAIDISPLAGANDAKLRFIYHDANPSSRFWWAVDDIEVRGEKVDLQIDSIVSPTAGCTLLPTDTLKVSVTNTSNFGVFPVQIAYQIDNDAPVYKYFVANLDAGADTLLNFNKPFGNVSNGAQLKVWIHAGFDADPINDTAVVTFSSLNITPDLGPDTALCAGQTYTLKANVPGADSYQWVGNNSTYDSLVVSTSGKYVVIVRKDGCTAKDSVLVGFPPAPTGTISASQNTIYLTDSVNLSITTPATTVTWYFGTDAIPATATGIGPHKVKYTTAGMKDVKAVLEQYTCVDTLDFQLTVNSGIGVDEHLLNQVSLYPNPGNGVYQLEVPSSLQFREAQIVNLSGTLVQRIQLNGNETYQLELNAPKGVYVLKLIGKEGSTSLKLIKK